MSLLEALRRATVEDFDRDLAVVLNMKPGDRFSISKDGLTVGNETVPYDVALAEILRVSQPPAPPAPSRIVIRDL